MEKRKPSDYKSKTKPSWCPGCGDYAVLASLMSTFADLNLDPDQTAVVSGIGCSSRFPFFTKTYGFHTIHGRALPIAMGLKTHNPKLDVVTVGGDGDGFSIGGNHFIHAARKNPNITYIVMDNEIYALTKGQHSPTSHNDLLTKITPYETVEERINPVLMALSFEASFVARGFSGDVAQLKQLIKAGMEHEGFSFIHVISPCVQYNERISYDSVRERIKQTPEDHDVTDKISGMKLAFTDKHIYTGLIYKVQKPTLEQKIDNIINIAQERAGEENCNIKQIMQQFA